MSGCPCLCSVSERIEEAGYQVTILDQRVRKNFDALLADASARNRSTSAFRHDRYQIGYGLSVARAVRPMIPGADRLGRSFTHDSS